MPDESESSFAERLTQAMQMRGASQSSLAAKLGVSRGAVSGWTLGRYQPTHGHMVELASHLNVSRRWLLHGDGAPERTERAIMKDDPVVRALTVAKQAALRLDAAVLGGKPVEKLAAAERALDLIQRNEIFELVVRAHYALTLFVKSANDSLETGTKVDFEPLHSAQVWLSQLGDYVPPVELIEAIHEARERHAAGPGESDDADAKRQAARDASPEGTTDVLVIDDDWVELSEATQKAAKESKG